MFIKEIKSIFATSASTRTGKLYYNTLLRIEDAGSMEESLIKVSLLYGLTLVMAKLDVF